jgi:hypothetical protein
MGVNRLAGRYSAVSKPNTPIVSEITAIHADSLGSALFKLTDAASVASFLITHSFIGEKMITPSLEFSGRTIYDATS